MKSIAERMTDNHVEAVEKLAEYESKWNELSWSEKLQYHILKWLVDKGVA